MVAALIATKRTLNAIREGERRQVAPEQFLFYNNPVITKNDRLTEELVLQINKPARPSDAFIGKPGYYEVDEFRDQKVGFLT